MDENPRSTKRLDHFGRRRIASAGRNPEPLRGEPIPIESSCVTEALI